MSRRDDLLDQADHLRGRTGWHHLKPPYRWPTVLGFFLVVAVIIWTGWFPDIPRRLKLAFYAFVAAAVLGYPAAVRIVDYLYRPEHTYLVGFNAEKDEIGVWKLPPSSWRDLEITEGELYSLQAAHPAWECRSFDPDELQAEGSWRGSATDLELIESREAINEVRNDLEDLAKEGLTVRVKQSSIVRGAVRDIVQAFISDYETETLYDGDELQAKVDEAIDHWDLDEPQQEQEELDETHDDQTQAEPNIENFRTVVDSKGEMNNGN